MRIEPRLSTLALCVAACAMPLNAQLAPDTHFGANAFPPVDPEFRLSLSFNRFTEMSGTGGVYNDITETMGFNMIHVSVADQIPAYPDFTFTVSAGGGRTDDQPTRFLQNEFLHNTWGLRHVPVDDTRNAWDYMGGGSLTWGREGKPFDAFGGRGRVFLGVGAVLGSLYEEPYAHLGCELHFPSTNLKIGLMDRYSLPRGGDAFPNLAHRNNIVQLYVGYVPERLDSTNIFMEWLGNPEIGLTFTHDSGFFLEGDQNPATQESGEIDMNFVSLRFAWPTGLRFELWNDIINGTDKGPSVGMTFSVDVLALVKQRWL